MVVVPELGEPWLDWSAELGDWADGLVLEGLLWFWSGAVLDGFWVAGLWLVGF